MLDDIVVVVAIDGDCCWPPAVCSDSLPSTGVPERGVTEAGLDVDCCWGVVGRDPGADVVVESLATTGLGANRFESGSPAVFFVVTVTLMPPEVGSAVVVAVDA